MRRAVLTLLAVAAAGTILVAFVVSSRPSSDESGPATTSTTTAAPSQQQPQVQPAPVEAAQEAAAAPPSPADQPQAAPLDTLVVVEATETQPEPALGSVEGGEANLYAMRIVLTPWGAGVKSIELTRYFETAQREQPYLIQSKVQLAANTVRYPLAADHITVNGQILLLRNQRWQYVPDESTDARQTFTITIAKRESGTPVLRIHRTYELQPGRYDLKLHQRVENLTDAPLNVQLAQMGQADMPMEGGYMGDRRTVTLGHFQPGYDPSRTAVFTGDFVHPHANVVKDAQFQTLWPTNESESRKLELVFAAISNRYFTTAVHVPTVEGDPGAPGHPRRAVAMDQTFAGVGRDADSLTLAVTLTSRPVTIAPRQAADLSVALFAGPKSPDVVEADPDYTALGLEHLIVYDIGGCCSFLTFAWLAKLLLGFLKLLHTAMADWGLAIIVLVIVVRAILHPITKKSQVNMMKVGRQMQALGPEMQRLKEKYKDDSRKLNEEMLKLYREKGVNPAAMGLGCLPMFLQMPIWIALYAMLYFAIELRHESAFYGVFQLVSGGKWRFLADLSDPDHFLLLGKASFTIPLLGWYVDALNVLPILMAVVFFVQQQYMSPPQQNLSEQAAQQQKMMKYMMLLFPIFLYKAPAGLTLYMVASSCAGILDSYLVRKHLEQQEKDGTLLQKKQHKPGGIMDRLQKMAEAKRKQFDDQQRRLEGNQPRRSDRRPRK